MDFQAQVILCKHKQTPAIRWSVSQQALAESTAAVCWENHLIVFLHRQEVQHVLLLCFLSVCPGLAIYTDLTIKNGQTHTHMHNNIWEGLISRTLHTQSCCFSLCWFVVMNFIVIRVVFGCFFSWTVCFRSAILSNTPLNGNMKSVLSLFYLFLSFPGLILQDTLVLFNKCFDIIK